MASISILVHLSSDMNRVKRCVEALLLHTPKACDITFLGDKLPAELRQYVSAFCRKGRTAHISLLSSPVSVSYKDTVISALRNIRSAYTIVMDDSVIVTDGWVSKLQACLMSEPCLGIVCPFIDRGFRHSVCTDLPDGATTIDARNYLDKTSRREYPRITSADACLLIKRAVLDKVDLNQIKDHFEPELCHQARRFGFNVAIADDCFVSCTRNAMAPPMGDDQQFYAKQTLFKYRQAFANGFINQPKLATSTKTKSREVILPKSKVQSNPKPPHVTLSRSIKVLSPSDSDVTTGKWWGDFWVKRDLENEFRNLGWEVREAHQQATVSLLLYGGYYDSSSPIRAVWIYSHPNDALQKLLNPQNFDLVYTLSHKHLDKLTTMRSDVMLLWPATAKKFQQLVGPYKYDIVVVGNATKEGRVRAVKRLVDSNKFNIGIIGSRWDAMIGRHIKAEQWLGSYWDNQRYAELFAQTKMTVYAHHEDMRQEEFVAVRILDVMACSSCLVICDDNAGLQDLGLSNVPIFRDDLSRDGGPHNVVKVASQFLYNDNKRIEMTKEARKVIQKYHTFEKRARQLVADFEVVAANKGIQLV